jgi:hypothetical protein
MESEDRMLHADTCCSEVLGHQIPATFVGLVQNKEPLAHKMAAAITVRPSTSKRAQIPA